MRAIYEEDGCSLSTAEYGAYQTNPQPYATAHPRRQKGGRGCPQPGAWLSALRMDVYEVCCRDAIEAFDGVLHELGTSPNFRLEHL